jgi:hypothetical protein
VKVTLEDEANGTEIQGVTDSSGFYSFDPIPPSTYTLKVQKEGFKTYVQAGLVVDPAERLDVSVTLQIGQVTQEVNVTASAAKLAPTDSGAKIDVIEGTQIENLSTMGRNAIELLTILPGVANLSFDPSRGSSGDTDLLDAFATNGLQLGADTLRLDNADMLETAANRAQVIEPNMDQIAEVSVKSSSFEADQGRSPYSIEAITKSGGSQFHGMLYWYHRDGTLNANDFSNDLAGLSKPNDHFNYPGFNVGGPVLLPGTGFNRNRDKMFFFVGVEYQDQLPDYGTELADTPTANERTGNLGDLLNTTFCTTNSEGVVTGGRYLNQPCILNDPNNPGTPLVGNVLPASEVTTNGKILLNLFPQPNYVDPYGQFNYAGRPANYDNRNTETIKVDYNLSTNTRMFVRLARNYESLSQYYGLWATQNASASTVPWPTPIAEPTDDGALSLNIVRTINPTLVNEFQFNVESIHNNNHLANPSLLSKSALGMTFNGLFNNGTDLIPQMYDVNYSPGTIRSGAGDLAAGVFYKYTEFEFIDNLTKTHATHMLKFGFQGTRIRNDQNSSTLTEGELYTVEDYGLTSGDEYGDILTDHYAGFSQASTDPLGVYRMTTVEGYAQDSWKATKRLTLNYGARLSRMQPWTEQRNLGVTFDPADYNPAQSTSLTNGLLLASKGQIPQSVVPDRSLIVQPRVGFAWDVRGGGNSVLRGGFGEYVPRDQANYINFVATMPPNSYSSFPIQQFTSLGQISEVNPYGSVGNIGLTALNPHDKKQSEVYEWSLTWTQNVGHKTVLETSYVGNSSVHLFTKRDINAAPLGSMWAPGTQTLTSTNDQAFRPYAPWGDIDWADRSSTSNYNGLQVVVRRTISNGLTLMGTYTYSKTLGFEGCEFTGCELDSFYPQQNYGLLSFDRPQIFNLSFIYPLPRMGAKYFSGNRIVGGVLDGWQLSGVTHYTSGAPLNVYVAGISCVPAAGETNPATLALCNTNNFTGDGRTWYGTGDESVRPIILSNPQSGAKFTGMNSYWLNPASVSIPTPGKLGTFEQPTFLTPGSNDWDFTLFKRFRIGETRELEFRWAAFDIFNRAQLDAPNTGALFNWMLQPGATTISQGSAQLANPDSFGIITDKYGHRQMELAIKFRF